MAGTFSHQHLHDSMTGRSSFSLQMGFDPALELTYLAMRSGGRGRTLQLKQQRQPGLSRSMLMAVCEEGYNKLKASAGTGEGRVRSASGARIMEGLQESLVLDAMNTHARVELACMLDAAGEGEEAISQYRQALAHERQTREGHSGSTYSDFIKRHGSGVLNMLGGNHSLETRWDDASYGVFLREGTGKKNKNSLMGRPVHILTGILLMLVFLLLPGQFAHAQGPVKISVSRETTEDTKNPVPINPSPSTSPRPNPSPSPSQTPNDTPNGSNFRIEALDDYTRAPIPNAEVTLLENEENLYATFTNNEGLALFKYVVTIDLLTNTITLYQTEQPTITINLQELLNYGTEQDTAWITTTSNVEITNGNTIHPRNNTHNEDIPITIHAKAQHGTTKDNNKLNKPYRLNQVHLFWKRWIGG